MVNTTSHTDSHVLHTVQRNDNTILAVSARDCRTNDSDSASIPTLYVSSQQDLDGLDGCTNLTGNIVLLSDYSGPFRLNGVTDLNGGIEMNASGYSENVESFEMLDVVNYAGVLQLYQVPDVRLPKVERMNELSLRSYKGGKADLGALVESELVGIAGVYECVSNTPYMSGILTAEGRTWNRCDMSAHQESSSPAIWQLHGTVKKRALLRLSCLLWSLLLVSTFTGISPSCRSPD